MLGDGHEAPLHIGIRCEACKLQVFDRSIPILMGDAMTELLALSVSVAVLGGIWAFIALGPLGGFALVWVGFIAAGCFFAAGGDIKALSKTIVGMIYGAIVAWIALLIIAKLPVPGLGTVLAGDRRWSNSLLSCYRRLHRSALLRASQCLWVCRAGGLHVVGGKAGCADGRGQLQSAIPCRRLRHLGSRARLPYGAIGWCAEIPTQQDGYFRAKQHLIRRLADHCSRELVLGYGGDAVVSHAS